ncbi:hypothetical protein GCK32_008466 [Trichostrongylus colubriformis]|uniref:aECM cysteine-cradle domain-containing protein n=1 Tax=Trichostrongylus colubriformis TaxID=6319 RepID=A0AAN8FAX2_TRICO
MLTPEPTEAPTSSRKITIKMGSQWGIPEITPQTPLLPAQPSAQSLVPVQPTETQAFAMPAPAYGKTLSREQLNKICVDTQTTSRKFGISDPKSFALNNCPLVQMYYKHVTCEQINHVMEYCEQNLLLV